jgi:hypothetical protein
VRTSPTVEGGENTRNDRSHSDSPKVCSVASLSPFTGFQGHFSPLTSSSLPPPMSYSTAMQREEG